MFEVRNSTFTRVFTENKKKIGTLTITTYNDEENNEATSVESAPNTSSDDPEHAGTQQLSSLTQIRNSTQKPPQVRAGVQSDHGHLPTRQRPTGRILRNIHRVPQPGSVRERHQHMEGAKTADHCEGALEDLRVPATGDMDSTCSRYAPSVSNIQAVHCTTEGSQYRPQGSKRRSSWTKSQVIFRPVDMMVPDFVMIPQIHLSARVFTNPFTLARKIDAPSTLSMSQRLRTQKPD
ncbi:hypothetical protein BLNAU_25073 [Blattamonas nauphoetae]|uniref:Uncharacterized protein n=1 Tax=Blattamonas nauphoetae TaxID=2049346 RepID=A0ABQ9WMM3_9EUKA|nr:hypothetical protein BLNAU_25073 [Blattamonas nauphoetae]